MINVELPDRAKLKLQDLQLARDAALDAGRSATARLTNRDLDERMRDKLQAEQSRQQHRSGQLSQLVSRCNQWLTELRGSTLEVAPPPVIEDWGTDLSVAVDSARDEIASTKQQLQIVRAAPLPLADQKRLAEQYVVKLMRQGKPTVAVVRDELKVTPRGDVLSVEDTLALIAWAAPDALCRALEREIAALPERPGAMPAAERVRRVAELEAQLLELERKEEALIMQAEASGQEILRRVDADPRAVLSVEITQAAQQVA